MPRRKGPEASVCTVQTTDELAAFENQPVVQTRELQAQPDPRITKVSD